MLTAREGQIFAVTRAGNAAWLFFDPVRLCKGEPVEPGPNYPNRLPVGGNQAHKPKAPVPLGRPVSGIPATAYTVATGRAVPGFTS